MLFDGQGREAAGVIASATRSGVEVEVQDIALHPRLSPELTLAVALPKGPRQDLLIEKCTELGVATLVPLLTERSVSGTSEHKLERWRRTAIEAAKQSGQAWIPQFEMPESFERSLGRIPAHDQALIAHGLDRPGTLFESDTGAAPAQSESPGERRPFPTLLARPLVFVGPEGGWAPAELDALLAAGCRPLSLGPNILRIETAAIAVAVLAHFARQPP